MAEGDCQAMKASSRALSGLVNRIVDDTLVS